MAELTVSNSLIEKMRKKYSSYNIAEYALFHREVDDSYEILGLMSDPTIDPKDFLEREILFPKKWVTLEVVPSENMNEY